MALPSGDGAGPRQDDRYRRIVETAHNGIWEIAADGATLYANPRMGEMLGVTPEEMLGRSTFDFVFPEDVEKGMVYFALRRGGDRGTFKWRFRRADGSELWTLASCHPVLDADGSFIGAAGIFSDLTEQRLAEERLRASEERFRASVDTLLDCFGIYSAVRDAQGRIADFRTEYLNDAACHNNRLPLEEQVGRTLLQLMPNHRSTGLFDDYCRVVETGEPFSKETVFYEDDYAGEHLGRWFDIRANRLGDGFAVAWREVTERKRAETELRRQHDLLQAVLDSTSDIVFVKDTEGRYLLVNHALTEMAEKPAEEILGKPDGDLFPGESPERLRQVGEDDRRAMALPEGELLRFEEEVVTPRGRRHCLTTKAAYHGADGRVLGVIGIVRDITERKLVEDTLREADRRKDEFLAMLAHELRNPLAPIRNSVEILRLLGGEQPLMKQARDTIDRQVTHMSRLLDDLLDVSRVARGKIRLHQERCDLARIVWQTAEDYRGTLEAGGLHIGLRMPAGPLWVTGDPVRLAQVVSNVLHNSGKFTEPGGAVTVTLEEAPDGVADLRIRDTGIGMEPEMVARAFDTFSQADSGLDRSRGGLGLGLALVKGLVELHGGTAAASSPGPGQGTEIAIRLPLEPTPLG
ncbi:MAG TPA: PAS domain-containing protein [Thermoanaerobaculia bacterium]|nr:PAS domain-containing protein [Thermoanaerobaculia bacterium]